MYFCFGARSANSKFTTKTAKKCEYFHSSRRNYQEKLITLKFYRDFKDWRRRTFSERVQYYPEDLDTWCRSWNRHHRKPGGHRLFFNQQKSANTNKKTATDMNSLHESHWCEKWENWKLTCVWAWATFVEIFLNARRKNGEDYEPATVSSVRPSIQRYLNEKKIHSTYSRTMSSKNLEKSSRRSAIHRNCILLIRNRVPYNKPLTNRACSSHTGEYWSEFVPVFPSTALALG